MNDARYEASTEIVYVCSPNRWKHALFSSLRSLLASGSTFHRVVIFCVGKKPAYWKFEDPRIEVQEVSNCQEDFFFLNKLYAASRKSDRVIYLDTDTLILRPIDEIWEGNSLDLIARKASFCDKPKWNADAWREVLEQVGGRVDSPYLNAGFMIFQNGAQMKIKRLWREFTRGGLEGKYFDAGTIHSGRNFCEQIAFSLAASVSGVSVSLMNPQQLGFGWEREPFEKRVIYHTGGNRFDTLAPFLEDHFSYTRLDLPKFLPSRFPNEIQRRRFWRMMLFRCRHAVLRRSYSRFFEDPEE